MLIGGSVSWHKLRPTPQAGDQQTNRKIIIQRFSPRREGFELCIGLPKPRLLHQEHQMQNIWL